MKQSTRITRMARSMMVLMLTLSLVTGLAVLGDGAYAATSTSSPFANTKSSYQHNTRYDGNLIVHGVDVSYFQSAASDWNKAKKNGCDFTIMRVTYTTYGSGSLNIDSKFATHFKKAKAAGVMKGVYVFSQAKSVSEARKEATYAVNRLKALGIGPADLELPVYMDYEFAGKSRGKNKGRLYGLKKSTAIKCVNAFAEVIRENGYDPGVYANTNFFRSYLGNGTTLDSDIDLWDAQYYHLNESPSNYSKWQYTSTAKVKGILYYSTNKIGSTDADFWYLNKRTNEAATTEIYGNTYLKYTGKAVLPELEIYSGSKLLKEGTDYVVGGINNLKKSTSGAYAYVKGIGSYGGYALVPLAIGKSYIAHTGLNGVGGAIFSAANGASYKIASGTDGAYVRNVSADTTAKTLLKNLKLKSKYKDDYELAVIDEKGEKVKKSTQLRTGMMVGVFSDSELKGTADITVNGDTLNDRGANYLQKADRSTEGNSLLAALTAAADTSDEAEEASSSDDDLVVDGIGGSATIKKLQEFLGVKKTGKVKISKKNQKYTEAVKAVKKGKKDTTVKAMQKWLGITANGAWGKKTSKALQKKLGVKSDGYFGKKSMKALQKFLNKQ